MRLYWARVEDGRPGPLLKGGWSLVIRASGTEFSKGIGLVTEQPCVVPRVWEALQDGLICCKGPDSQSRARRS